MNIEYEDYADAYPNKQEGRVQLLTRAYLDLGLPLSAAWDSANADLAENLEEAKC